jgi:hypothetical protein
MKKQSSQYDKIIKENLEAVIPGLIKNLLGIIAIETEELPDDIQRTKERKPDALKKIKDSDGNTFVLHIEFQLRDEPEMIFRMLEYYGLLARTYKLPVHQYVIFLGNKTPKMKTKLTWKGIGFEYKLLTFNQIDYRIFLASDKPEEIMLGVLGNFGNDTPEEVSNNLIQRIKETSNGDFLLLKHLEQLRSLSRICKLESLFTIIMDSVSKYIDEKTDVLYIKGKNEGLYEGKKSFVQYLIEEGEKTFEQISDIAGVPLSFVQEVAKTRKR